MGTVPRASLHNTITPFLGGQRQPNTFCVSALLRLAHGIISFAVTVLMGRHTERMQLSFNDLRRGCSAEEEKTVIHFLRQCPQLGYLAPQPLSP